MTSNPSIFENVLGGSDEVLAQRELRIHISSHVAAGLIGFMSATPDVAQ
jgi:hypothetical protein